MPWTHFPIWHPLLNCFFLQILPSCFVHECRNLSNQESRFLPGNQDLAMEIYNWNNFDLNSEAPPNKGTNACGDLCKQYTSYGYRTRRILQLFQIKYVARFTILQQSKPEAKWWSVLTIGNICGGGVQLIMHLDWSFFINTCTNDPHLCMILLLLWACILTNISIWITYIYEINIIWIQRIYDILTHEYIKHIWYTNILCFIDMSSLYWRVYIYKIYVTCAQHIDIIYIYI